MNTTARYSASPENARLTIEWRLPPGQARPITLALGALLPDIRLVHGCLRSLVSTELADNVSVRYEGDWQTEEDLQAYLRSNTFRSLIGLIDGTSEAPHVEFRLPSGVRGLDYLRDVRPLA